MQAGRERKKVRKRQRLTVALYKIINFNKKPHICVLFSSDNSVKYCQSGLCYPRQIATRVSTCFYSLSVGVHYYKIFSRGINNSKTLFSDPCNQLKICLSICLNLSPSLSFCPVLFFSLPII